MKEPALPPRWVNSILSKVCKPELLEEIEGDLLEYYQYWVEKYGVKKANRLYAFHAIKFLRPFAIKKTKTKLNKIDMFSSYVKVARRSLWKHKMFSFINISGLTVGLTCCILISLYIRDELSYDRFHEKSDKIYRLTREFKSPDGSTALHLAHLAPPFVPLLEVDFPEMETMTRFVILGETIRHKDKIYNEPDVGFADNNIFKVFSFDFVKGNPNNALSLPGSMVITEEAALKYFDTTDVLGETLEFIGMPPFKITGVIKKMPENSHFNLEIIIDFSPVVQFYGGRESMMSAWGSNNFSTYFVLAEGANIAQIENQLPEFLKKNLGENALDWNELHIQKMTDIHLHSHLDDELGSNSDIKYIYLFSSIGILILLIALINYMNLATAKSSNRAKEVGVRKVLGASKPSLINQFMTESVLLASLSSALALCIVPLALPYLRRFTQRAILYETNEMMLAIGIIIGLGTLVGLLAGSYPALYLSAFKPLEVLRGKLAAGVRRSLLRQVLVVVQFSISALLIVSTAVVFQQLNFIQSKNLGYDKDHVLTLRLNDDIWEHFDTFKHSLKQNASVINVCASSRVPTNQLLDSQVAMAQVDDDMLAPSVTIKDISVDEEFLNTYDIKLVAGRNFDRTIASDMQGFILNESAVRMIGWKSPQEAIDKRFRYGNIEGRIIGIIQDFHFETLQNEISPIVLHGERYKLGRNLSIKLSGNNIAESLTLIEKEWARFSPNVPINYTFLDTRFNLLYRSEKQRAKLFTFFSTLAIFLACLGLFGLASFMVTQRAKEVSIRKVLGASIAQIMTALSKEFVILVLISVAVGFPVAYLLMEDWLQNYAYRIDLGFLPFLLAAGISITIALLTISLQTFKSATSNPVDMLKDE
ncbi:MAG: ABC transporter permease [Cyclobacteriaceae bacterium]